MVNTSEIKGRKSHACCCLQQQPHIFNVFDGYALHFCRPPTLHLKPPPPKQTPENPLPLPSTPPNASDYVSWSSSQIVVKVPERAGTGLFYVNNTLFGLSPSELNIGYAHTCINSDYSDFSEATRQRFYLRNMNGNGRRQRPLQPNQHRLVPGRSGHSLSHDPGDWLFLAIRTCFAE